MCCRTDCAISHRNAAEQQKHKEGNPVQRTLLRNAAEAKSLMEFCRENVMSAETDLEQRQKDRSDAKTKPPRSMSREKFLYCHPTFVSRLGLCALKHIQDINQCEHCRHAWKVETACRHASASCCLSCGASPAAVRSSRRSGRLPKRRFLTPARP